MCYNNFNAFDVEVNDEQVAIAIETVKEVFGEWDNVIIASISYTKVKRSEWYRWHLNGSLFLMVWGLYAKIDFETKG